MCIDCARRKLRQFKQRNPIPAEGWFMCIVDHDDHIHVLVLCPRTHTCINAPTRARTHTQNTDQLYRMEETTERAGPT